MLYGYIIFVVLPRKKAETTYVRFPRTPNIRIEGFVRATVCYSDSRKLVIKTSILSINLIGTITVYSKFSSNELLKSYIAS